MGRPFQLFPLPSKGRGRHRVKGVGYLGPAVYDRTGTPTPGGWYTCHRRNRVYQSDSNGVPKLYQHYPNTTPSMPGDPTCPCESRYTRAAVGGTPGGGISPSPSVGVIQWCYKRGTVVVLK